MHDGYAIKRSDTVCSICDIPISCYHRSTSLAADNVECHSDCMLSKSVAVYHAGDQNEVSTVNKKMTNRLRALLPGHSNNM